MDRKHKALAMGLGVGILLLLGCLALLGAATAGYLDGVGTVSAQEGEADVSQTVHGCAVRGYWITWCMHQEHGWDKSGDPVVRATELTATGPTAWLTVRCEPALARPLFQISFSILTDPDKYSDLLDLDGQTGTLKVMTDPSGDTAHFSGVLFVQPTLYGIVLHHNDSEAMDEFLVNKGEDVVLEVEQWDQVPPAPFVIEGYGDDSDLVPGHVREACATPSN